MNAFRIQGVLFSILALGTALSSLLFARLSPQTELIILAVLIVTLGVPHGALDTIFAKQIYNTRTPLQWTVFSIVYLCLALVVVGIWLLSPFVFLCGFLLISMAHFSGDLAGGTPWPVQVVYGGAILILPLTLHSEEVSQLFTLLGGSSAAHSVTFGLKLLSWPWLFACCVSIAAELKIDKFTAFELAALTLLAVAAPPLIAFTVFFCTMHSARHVMRTLKLAGNASPTFLSLAATVPMAGVLALSLISWRYFPESSIDSRIVQFIFVGLAALTVPHMALVEQARVSGWMKAEIHG